MIKSYLGIQLQKTKFGDDTEWHEPGFCFIYYGRKFAFMNRPIYTILGAHCILSDWSRPTDGQTDEEGLVWHWDWGPRGKETRGQRWRGQKEDSDPGRCRGQSHWTNRKLQIII